MGNKCIFFFNLFKIGSVVETLKLLNKLATDLREKQIFYKTKNYFIESRVLQIGYFYQKLKILLYNHNTIVQ